MPKIWKQFSGQWTVTQAAQAKGAGTWPTLPGAPTIGTATAGNAQASVAFTAPANPGYPTTLTYEVTSSPGGLTGTGSASPIVVTGLSNGTSYTFTVTATNDTGTGPASAASNAAIPVAPTELYSWGINSAGQLGLGDQNISRSSPTQVGALTTWLSIDSFYHAIALQTDGTLWTWGSNGSGRLGLNSGISEELSPVQVGSGTWNYATAGGQSSLAISSAGNLYAWGDNSEGQIGNNSTGINYSSPVQVGASTNWAQVSAQYNSSFGILSTGALFSWGANGSGVLGHGSSSTSDKKSSPTQIGALTTWLQVDAGGEYNCAAIKTDGTLWTWGIDTYGQLGHPGPNPTNSPMQVGALTNWAQVSEGYQTCMAVKTDGTLWGWGRNSAGQIGDNSRTDRNSPVQIGSLTTWAAVGSGNGASIALKTDGTLWTMGNNEGGVSGQNEPTTVFRSSPVQVGALTTWTKVNISRWSNGLAFAIKN